MKRELIMSLGLVIPRLLVPATVFALPSTSGNGPNGVTGPANNQAPSTLPHNHVNTGQLNPGFGCHMELGKEPNQGTAQLASNGNCDPF